MILTLRECSHEYWDFVRFLRTHPENQDGFFSDVEISDEDQKNFMQKNSSKYKICLLEDIPVGYVGTINQGEVTYCVHPDFKGRGIGKFMISEFSKSFDKLEAYVKEENIGSQSVFEKIGWIKKIYYKYEKNSSN